MSDAEEKVHRPTPRRRAEARARGYVARSTELSAAVALFVGVLALGFAGERVFGTLMNQLSASLEGIHEARGTDAIARLVTSLGGLGVIAPFVILIALVSLGASLAQGGLVFAWESLAPRLGRLIPTTTRLWAPSRLFMGLVKLVAVGGVLGVTLWSEREALAQSARAPLILAHVVWCVTIRAALAFLVLGVLDYAWRRGQMERALRMTPAQMRDEMRRQEGAPEVREQRRRVRKQLADARTIRRERT